MIQSDVGRLLCRLRKMPWRLIVEWLNIQLKTYYFFTIHYFPIFLHLWNGDLPYNLWHFTITAYQAWAYSICLLFPLTLQSTNHLKTIWGRDLSPGCGLKLSTVSIYSWKQQNESHVVWKISEAVVEQHLNNALSTVLMAWRKINDV